MLENRNRAPNWSGAEPPPPLYISGTPRRVTQVVVSLWLLGWLLEQASRWSDLLVNARVTAGDWFLWCALWSGVGLAVAWALVWVAAGKHESLERVGDRLWRVRRVGRFAHRSGALATQVRGLTVEPARDTWLGDLVAVLSYWAGGNGRVSFMAGARWHGVGADLDDRQAQTLAEAMAQRLPQARLATGGQSRRAAVRTVLVGLGMFFWLASGVLKTPVVLYFDRGSCGLASANAPADPIDVRSSRPPGVVRLAPLGAFPEAEVRALATHFRTTYGTAVEVEPRRPYPAEALDQSRGQLDARVIVRWLTSRAPAAPEFTLVALTDQDLFISGVPWRYAYGYRDTDRRVAVVSTWRMRLGCLGLVPAGADLRASRLRKMVGKNIGLLHYGLELRDDPSSMLYYAVGGPQDLDLMSEQF